MLMHNILARTTGVTAAAAKAEVARQSWSERLRGRLWPTVRPITRNMASGIPTAATNPSGSRTKIRISSQVSFQSPRMVAA